MSIKRIILFFAFFVAANFLFAQSDFDANALLAPRKGTQTLVNDFAGILTAEQTATLERKLVALDDSTSTQITVVTVPTLNGNEIADFANNLGRAWGVGGKQNNNGVVFLISVNDRKVSIAPGYGLEGSLTDATASNIIQDVVVPNFRGNDYYRGISEGTDAIMQAVRGTYNTPRERSSGGKGGSILPFILIVIVIIIIMSRNNRGGGSFMSRRGARGFMGPMIFPTGGWTGGGGGGGWTGGGGSSGGFGGFGGGSFGGGGASGSW